jgi:hypothetical protein
MRLLRGLGSQLLPCGCLAGIYETYGGPVVRIVDVKGDDCPESGHRVGEQEGEIVAPEAGAAVAAGLYSESDSDDRHQHPVTH